MTFQIEKYYVYTLLSLKDKKFYTGFTTDLKDRLSRHARGEVKFTTNRRPLRLIHYEYFIYEDDARAREVFLKSGFGRDQFKKSFQRTLSKFRKWQKLRKKQHLSYNRLQPMKFSIRLLYLYLFSFIGLLICVIGIIRILDLGMKIIVFKDADKYEIYPTKLRDGNQELPVEEMQVRKEKETTRNRQRELSSSLSMILVGIPLYLYHWKTIQNGGWNKKP